jgi:hypothetical protein
MRLLTHAIKQTVIYGWKFHQTYNKGENKDEE